MIRVFFGNPGVGKTTLCCKMAKKNEPRYSACYLNFPHKVPHTYHFTTKQADESGLIMSLGDYGFKLGSYIGIDEASIEYNNRAFKSLPRSTIEFFKLHRHYACDIDVFSQAWDDMDITIRRLAVQLWYMYRIGPWTLCRRVYKRTMVDKNTHQIIDGYKMASMLWLPFWFLQLGFPFDKRFTLTFRPFYYKYFDSWDAPELPLCNATYNKSNSCGSCDRVASAFTKYFGIIKARCITLRDKVMHRIKS